MHGQFKQRSIYQKQQKEENVVVFIITQNSLLQIRSACENQCPWAMYGVGSLHFLKGLRKWQCFRLTWKTKKYFK